MSFFRKRTLSPRERFESALREKQAARGNLAERLKDADATLGERRDAAERLAIGGATDAQLDRAETEMRAAEDRAKTLRVALGQLDEQIVATERELADAKAQRDRDIVADELVRMVAEIERAAPRFDALVAAVTQSAASMPEAINFAANVDAVRREVLLAVQLVCAEVRSTAVRTRAGNTNIGSRTASAPDPLRPSENEHQLVYTLNPLLWRENGKVRSVPAYARVELPKILLLVALRHEHVDYLNARRVQTLMKVHGSGLFQAPPHVDDPRLVNLDALAARDQESAKAGHAA